MTLILKKKLQIQKIEHIEMLGNNLVVLGNRQIEVLDSKSGSSRVLVTNFGGDFVILENKLLLIEDT